MTMRVAGICSVALAITAAAPTFAADVVALSPAEREATLNAAAARNADDLPINGLSRKVHGEVGMAIGSNGYRSLYGTSVVPLGQTGTLVVSGGTSQFGNRRR
jgi:hypothetical protein